MVSREPAPVDSVIGQATPRPWTNQEHSTFVHCPDGNVCACGDPRASTTVGYTEAEIGNLDEPVANARLIVRAVNSYADMLAVLKELADFIDPNASPPRMTNREIIARARTAIAKAEGRT